MRLHMPALLTGLAAITIAGCDGDPKMPVTQPPELDAPPAATLMEWHNQRLTHMQRIYGRGVVELEWTDEQGRDHREPQVDIEVWIDRPSHTAFRFDKFGEVYLWAGSDDQRFWLFDLTGEPRRLAIGGHDQHMRLDTDSVFAVRPLAMLDVLALAPLEESRIVGDVTWNEDLGAWAMDVASGTGRVRYFYSAYSGWLVRAELLDDAGDLVLQALLERYKTVELSDRAVLAPQLAHVMRISEAAGEASMEIFFDAISDGEEGDFARVFDLDRLRRALRPDVIDDSTSPTGGGQPVRTCR